MRKLIASLVLALVSAAAGAQMVTVHGSKLTDSTGASVSGTLTFRPVTSTGQPIGYKKGGGGQASTAPIAVAVAAGVFSVQLPDTSLTNPLNVCFSATLSSTGTGYGLGAGYACVQPAANNSWCTSGDCNFDNFVPSTPGLALGLQYVTSVNGQTGVVVIPAGSLGDSDVTGQTASQGTVNLVGTVPSSGKYRISYYADQHATCTTGANAVQFTFRWTDASAARSANSISLTLGSTQSTAAGSIQGVIPVYAVSSSAITYTSTVTGSCATGGPSSYDAHISVESVQ